MLLAICSGRRAKKDYDDVVRKWVCHNYAMKLLSSRRQVE